MSSQYDSILSLLNEQNRCRSERNSVEFSLGTCLIHCELRYDIKAHVLHGRVHGPTDNFRFSRDLSHPLTDWLSAQGWKEERSTLQGVSTYARDWRIDSDRKLAEVAEHTVLFLRDLCGALGNEKLVVSSYLQ
jgi:hypothetical protein